MRLYGKYNFLVTLILVELSRVNSWCLNRQTAEVGTVMSTQYSQDRSLFVTAANGKATLWSAVNFLILTRVSPASGTATDAKISKNNTIFAVATSTSMIYIYSTSSPYTLLQTITAGLGGSNTKIDFSYDGAQLLACGGTGTSAKIFNISAGGSTTPAVNNLVSCKFGAESINSWGSVASNNKIDYVPITGPPSTWTMNVNGCTDLDISVATPAYLVAVCGSKAYTMSVASPSPVISYTGGSTLRSSSISADGSYAAFGGDQKLIMFVDGSAAPTFTPVYNFTLDAEVYTSDFSADSNYLLVGTKSGSIYEYSKYCLDCPVGTYQNVTSLTCALCSLTNRGCGSCINSTYCVECTQGFYLETLSAVGVTDRKCVKCSTIEGCIVCNSSTVCIMCEVGYYLSGSTCATCNGPMPGCLRCNSSTVCEQCTSDYYLSGANKCVICTTIGGCSLCVSSTYCSICQIGYYNNAGTCSACSTNCLACQSATTCLDCRQGYYPTTGAIVCIACPTTGCLSCNQTGYCLECATNRYLDGTGNCVPCTFPCNECNSSVCINCMAGFYLDWATGGGTSALSGGSCQLCNHPCQTCNTSSYCLSCPLGYYLVSASHTCLTCDNLTPFCQECSPTACLNCSLGYYLDTATCKPCTTPMYSCVRCTSSSACLKCAPGFYLTANTGNSSCATCPGGCELCNSTAYCFGCLPGYFKDASNACVRCNAPCTICTSATACLQCEEQYYLPAASTTCAPCRDAISNCIACDDESALKCTSCRVGYFLSAGACTACILPCLVCNSSACLQCEIGYYLATGTCTLCPQNCTACTSSSVCSSCSVGFYLHSTDQKCYHCSAIGCMTCNSTLACLSCPQGYYLTATNTCDKCLSSMQFCEVCSAANVCQSCSFGYTLSATNDKCVVCSSIQGCFDCSSLTSCDVCENGYYLVTTSGSGVCNVCPPGCVTCSSSTSCITCLPSFILQSTSCKLCQQLILGCQLCTDASTCIDCSNGYYSSGSSCNLCRSAMKGCQFCNSSSVCTYCGQGYYLLPNNTCSMCETTMQGCEVCQSSSVCKLCENGYYLSGGSCLICKSAMPGCLSCTDASTCLQCVESYAIDAATLQCSLCKSSITGCISCSSLSYCEQCQAGYYLRTTDHTCQACTQVGCEICYQTNPATCVGCNTMYFMSVNVCYYCGDYMEGCIQCTSNSLCTLCETGYFINGTNKCQLCQTSLEGCAKCNNSASCFECKSTYYLDTTINKCKTCLSALEGCAYCLDLSECISCSNSYYKNVSTGFCELCTHIEGCLACTDYDTCLVCKGDYFLQTNATENLCYPCNVMDGCYSCINNLTCIVCVGGYILNDDKLCEVYRVQADEPVKGMKMISQYVDENTLSHSLLANQMKYSPKQYTIEEWKSSTDIILQHPSFKLENLTISGAKWVSGNQLLFYTNNPVKIDIKTLPARRRLSAMPDGYKTLIKMKQDTINVILPDLYLSHSLVMDYDLSSPEFYASITEKKFNLFHSAFGIVIVAILTLNYIVKAVVTCPNQALSEYGQILPHFLALKAPAFIIFPLFPEQFSFCFGFMAAEFPWARDAFSTALSDKSETMPKQYSLFYESMSFGSTYILACCIGFLLIVMMWLYKKNNQKQHKTNNSKLRKEEPLSKEQQSKWGLPNWPIKMVMYNFFFFGLVFNGCASLQNAIYNPMSEISVSAVFTVMGIICFGLAFTDCLYSLYESPLYFFKLRIFTKAVLLSVCHFSPIYLFSSAFVVDLICLVIQYRLTIDHKTFPKLWVYNNIAMNVTLAILVFVHSHFTTLIIAGIFILSVIGIQFYVHYQDYITEKKRSRFMLKKQYKLQQKSSQIDDGLNIWNINFQKRNQSQIPSKDLSQPISPKKKSSKVKQNNQGLQTFYENRRIKPTRRPKKQKRANAIEYNQKEESQQNLDHLMADEKDGKDNNTFLAADFIN